MGAAVGRETDALRFLGALAAEPHRYDFYQTLRRLECLHPEKPRLGQALRPGDEPVRLGQEPELAFAPAPLAACEGGRQGAPPRLLVRLFGLLGPNGPLPLHFTEYARERKLHAGDATFSRFLDLLQHRFLAMFYQAWAQAQPHVNHDRPAADRFARYIGAFVGIAPASLRERDTIPDVAKLFHVGAFIRHTRGADGLTVILRHFFKVPVRIEPFVGHWMQLGSHGRTCLQREGATLGAGAVLGSRVWDRQHKFRIHVGPLTFAEYRRFLPGSHTLRQLVDWVRMYLGFELDWDLRLRLAGSEVPKPELGRGVRLGWTTWIGRRRDRAADADDLRLAAEAFVGGPGGAAA